MQGIVKHIEYLLDNHQCVILPGLGAFICQHQSAVIDDINGIITPPCRVVSFNRDLTHDDGLLATSYARQLSVPYTVAKSAVDNDIAHIKSQLTHNGEIEMGQLGQLLLKSEYIEFVPYDTLFTGLGYQSATLPQHVVNSIATRELATVTELPAVSHFNSRLHKVMRYAGMLVILLTVGVVMTTLQVSHYDHNAVKASLSPIDMITTHQESMTEYIDTPAPELLIAEPQAELIEEQQASAVESTPAYCLVIASLTNRELADQFITEARDSTLGVIESNGRYRVYAATGESIAEVMDAALCSRYPDAWPCRMN